MRAIEQIRALAIVGMGEGILEYNRGVLSMLGHEDLALAYAACCRNLQDLNAQRDAALDGANLSEVDRLFGKWPSTALDLNRQMAVVESHRRGAWEPIQAIIEEAHQLADPILSDLPSPVDAEDRRATTAGQRLR